MIYTKVEAGDLSGVRNQFKRIYASILRRGLWKQETLQRQVYLVQGDINDIVGKSLTSGRIIDTRSAVTSVSYVNAISVWPEEGAEVTCALRCRRLSAVDGVGLSEMKAFVAGEEEGPIFAVIKCGM